MRDEHRPTPAEMEILRVLWDRGPSTVREVHERLRRSPPVGYTTILKLLQIMHEKGLVARDEESRAHSYTAAIEASETERRLLEDLRQWAFGGSTSRLVLRALSDTPASEEELAEIRALIDRYALDAAPAAEEE